MSRFIFGEGGCARSLSLSFSLFFFRTLPFPDFFLLLTHSKLEVLKISGQKGSLSLSFPLSLETRAGWKYSHKRRNTEKSTRKITKKRNPRGHIRITFKPRFTPLRRFSSSPHFVKIVFILPSFEQNRTRNRFHWDKSRSELSLLRPYFDAFISSTMIAKCEYEERCYITYEILK